ncbi:MAG: site-2 protease family protein [Planctomycetota bacterium]
MILVEPRRTPWDLRWRMLGTPVRVHPAFWLMALLLCYQESVPFSLVMISVGCMLFSILVHEFGHALCGRYFGDRENRVCIYCFGGLCTGGRQAPGHWPQILICLWGPGAGFILGGLAYGVLLALRNGRMTAPNIYLLWALDSFLWFNLLWGAVNLLPIFPLDGGQILREAVTWKAPRRGDRLVFKVSFYAALLMAVLGLVLHFLGRGYGLFPVVFFGVLAYSSWHMLRQLAAYGGMAEHEEQRQSWEQDGDWWKK